MTEQYKRPNTGGNAQAPSPSGKKSPKINQQDSVKYDTKGSLEPKRINESKNTDDKK
ncbi:Uncharacterised protein [Yersinia pseudotuberculosis]|uniref:hypothetical protein n=1 Tax=Yersinia pseudotuberculosis TaxID=633 RepID=UPI0005E0ABCB|nr:hypothetical protein [Yersinia pseudotuberculosis]CFV38107.1 Uncharacterised protein [Yersinia pseudotuberculosis]CNF69327.1 Uncharacterised protein [Yersinia pseudotuberculosis]CNL20861.1 Uncharacterised protein [Yersinia pseudotuberculosis]BCU90701.1 hypothetical protein YP72344_21960 [Yersinia pseudotuberculosis]BET62821.1 hypothetical protein YPSE1_22800 [Yersinia pseudotuberculosis]